VIVEREWHPRWQANYDAMAACCRERRFEDAAAIMERAREEAIAADSLEESASYSALLSTCLLILRRDQDALVASEMAERLDPNEPRYSLRTVDLLLRQFNEPMRAHEKVAKLLQRLSEDATSRYHALSLLGQAKLALGDSTGAIALFREITSPRMMQRLCRAEYAGVYDLGLVCAIDRRRGGA
jgi:cytochrome c-type biogenesis protein CcmH/NrfG